MQTIEYYLHVNDAEMGKRFEYGPYSNLYFNPQVGEFFVLPLLGDAISGEVTAKTVRFDPGTVEDGVDVAPSLIIEITV